MASPGTGERAVAGAPDEPEPPLLEAEDPEPLLLGLPPPPLDELQLVRASTAAVTAAAARATRLFIKAPVRTRVGCVVRQLRRRCADRG